MKHCLKGFYVTMVFIRLFVKMIHLDFNESLSAVDVEINKQSTCLSVRAEVLHRRIWIN